MFPGGHSLPLFSVHVIPTALAIGAAPTTGNPLLKTDSSDSGRATRNLSFSSFSLRSRQLMQKKVLL
jgi:hypothetical protein